MKIFYVFILSFLCNFLVMKHKIASSVRSSLMLMDDLDFLLRTKKIDMKDTGLVLAKGPPILNLDNLSFGIYSMYYSMMCLR